MAVYWTIDSRQRLLTAVAEGVVRRDEMFACIDAMAGAKAVGYRRLFDGSKAEADMTTEEIMEVAVELRRLQTVEPSGPGPLAIVVPAERFEQLARVFGVLAIPKRPMRFFQDAEAAQSWLESPEIRDWAPEPA